MFENYRQLSAEAQAEIKAAHKAARASKSREGLLAWAFIRGLPYRRVEAKTRTQVMPDGTVIHHNRPSAARVTYELSKVLPEVFGKPSPNWWSATAHPDVKAWLANEEGAKAVKPKPFKFKNASPELQAFLDLTREDKRYYEKAEVLLEKVSETELVAYNMAEHQHAAAGYKASDEVKESLSPSGKYKLVLRSLATKPGCWNYMQGEVFEVASGKRIAKVIRNYCSFPHLFIEDHPNGHPYLLCGSDYQGQTVIELDTGKRKETLPRAAFLGFGFCCADFRFDPGTKLLTAAGCIWACPYEYRFFDFSDPIGSGCREIEYDALLDEENPWPEIDVDGVITCRQVDSKDKEKILSIQKFKVDGQRLLRLVRIEEWVSDEEKARRIANAEARKAYEAWVENLKTTHPLFLRSLELLKDPVFEPDTSFSIGSTHGTWCPTWKGDERRICRRVADVKGGYTLDLEFAVDTGPIKLCIYFAGKSQEPMFFPHDGMDDALAYAKTLLTTPKTEVA